MVAGVNITVSAYNRPEYLQQTLAALRSCVGIEECRVVVILDPCEETDTQVAISRRYGFEPAVIQERAMCNAAIRGAFVHGFDQMRSEFHVHLEDDTVPCRDALLWFAWARDAYRDNPAVMNVSGYQKISNQRPAEAGLRRWFTPWGWGTWRDRWVGLDAGWSRNADLSWDIVVNHALRAGRYEVFPTVSRIQNIGGEKGTHVPSQEWHREHHHVEETADDLGGGAVSEWKVTRIDDHADHA